MASELTPYQKDILVKTILGEARGEGVDGMAFVANVIQNRTNSGKFPSDPAAVALQNKQFSTWNSGEGGNNPQQFAPGTKAYEEAARIVDGVFSGQIPDNSGSSLQYHASNVTPYWADEANTNGTIRVGNHIGYPTHPVPPGEIPSVASLLDVRRQAPTPAVPTPATAAIRQMTSPTGGNGDLQSALKTYATRQGNRVTPASRYPLLSNGTGANISQQAIKPRRNLGDEIGMNPIQGGQQAAPMFDGVYDERLGAIVPSSGPVNTQGMGTIRSKAPAPVPATPSPQLAGRRATDPALQAALNARYPAALPGVGSAPTTRVVPTTRVGNSADNIVAQRNEQMAMRSPTPRRSPLTVPGPSAAPKTADRLAPRVGLAVNPTASPGPVQSGGLSRDALARQAAYTATMINPPPKTAPVVTPPRVTPQLNNIATQRAEQLATRAPAPMRPVPQPPRIAPVPFNRPPLLAASAPPPVARAPLMASAMLPAMPNQQLLALPPQMPAAPHVWMEGFTGAGTSGGAHGGSADNPDKQLQERAGH